MTSRSADNAISAVVGIGCSAGGLVALQGLFAALPERTRLCFVVVSHLAPDHDSELDSILQRHTPLTVQQVRGTMTMRPGHVYVIAPGQELRVRDGTLRSTDQSRDRDHRAPIDALFCSLAEAYGSRTLAMLLSGGSGDGMSGARAVRQAHGLVLVQAPDEAEFPELPHHAISLELADVVAPVQELATRVAEIAERGAHLPNDEDGLDRRQTDALRSILTSVRTHVGHDFSDYKRATVLRRLQRRMHVTQSRNMDAYASMLQGSSEEAGALYRDLLITVTHFFRDPSTFDTLQQQVIPKLFEGRDATDSVRVWSVGCATGEEAYSLAMLLLEHAGTLHRLPKLQVFASDIDQRALATARAGLYPATIEESVSAERLQRFFVREGDQYRVGRELRSTVLVARHNVLGDPPFTRVDLVACRNLLIYLQRPLQDKVLDIFHYALGESGYLFLGSAESAAGASRPFRAIDKKCRIYQARVLGHERPPPSLPLALSDSPDNEPIGGARGARPAREGRNENALHWRMLEDYGPPSLIVDESYRVVHLSERAGRYLRPSGGTPSHDLLRLAHPELQLELRRALSDAFDKGRATISRGVPIGLDGLPRMVYLGVRPRRGPENAVGLALITFDEDDAVEGASQEVGSAPEENPPSEYELTRTRERLQTTLEQFEASQQEMKAQNEELRSINEEYKSTTEELETSKEELHSVNEELQSVNAELEVHLDEVTRAHSDLQNLMAATEVGTLFLDRDLCVKRYTESVAAMFNLIPSDIGRPIADLSSRLVYDALEADARGVLRDLSVRERELHADDGAWYLMRMRPYRTIDDRIDGVVLTLVDITAQRQATEDQRRAHEFSEHVIDTVREGLLVLDGELRIESANRSFCEMFGLTQRDTEGELIYQVDGGEWDIAELRRALEQLLPDAQDFAAFEVHHTFPRIGDRVMLLNGRLLDEQGRILLAIEDVTDQHAGAALLERHNDDLKLADHHKDDFLAILGHELRNPLAALATGVPLIERGRDETERRWALDMVKNQIAMLGSLLDDLLELSRITHGKIELRTERIDLVQVVTHTLESMEGRARIELNTPRELVMEGDPRRLAQVVQNLLGNAIKYTPQDGHIALEVTERGTAAEITVTDDGDGIDGDALESIFERFTQKHPASGGLGIGLALVREIVTLHGGTVTAESAGPGAGSVFRLSFPLHRERLRERPAPVPDTLPDDVLNGVRILIVDDNEASALGMAVLLEQYGAAVTLAHNGTSAVATARAVAPSLILLDIGLPDIGGAEVARRLRAEPLLAAVPLVAVTGFAAARVGAPARALFDEWLIKPVEIERLTVVAARLLGVTLPQER